MPKCNTDAETRECMTGSHGSPFIKANALIFVALMALLMLPSVSHAAVSASLTPGPGSVSIDIGQGINFSGSATGASKYIFNLVITDGSNPSNQQGGGYSACVGDNTPSCPGSPQPGPFGYAIIQPSTPITLSSNFLSDNSVTINLNNGQPYNIEFTAADSSNILDTGSSSVQLYVNPVLGTPTLSLYPTAIDLGQTPTQSSTATVTVAGGTPGYTVTLYSSTSSSCSSTSTYVNATYLPSGSAFNTVTFNGLSPTSNTFYCAIVNDFAQVHETVISSSQELFVNPAPSSRVPVATATKIEIASPAQNVTITTKVSGGTSPYNSPVLLESTSASGPWTSVGVCKITGSTVTCTTSTYQSGAGTYYFEIKVSDSATTPATATSPASNPVNVDKAPTVSLNPTSASIDSGYHVTFTATPSSGFSPYTYAWNTTGLAQASGCTSSSVTCTVYQTVSLNTAYTISVTVTDNASTPVTSAPAKATLNVYPPLVATTPALSNTIIDAGQSTIMTTTISGGTPQLSGIFYSSDLGTCDSGGSLSSSPLHTNLDGSYSELTFSTSSVFNFGGNSNPMFSNLPCTMPIQAVFSDSGSGNYTSATTALTIHPALVVSTPSLTNTILDQGQTSSISATASGGTGSANYTYQWYEAYGAFGSSVGAFTPIANATSKTYDFISTTSTPSGQYEFKLQTTDTGTTTHDIVNSSENGLELYTAPTMTLLPADLVTDSGQRATYTANVQGGHGKFTIKLFRTSTNTKVANVTTLPNSIISSPGGSNSISLVPFTYGVENLNATATDLGTTTPYTFNSAKVTLSAGTMPQITILPSNTLLDFGQSETYNAVENGGNGPFNVMLYNITHGSQQGSNITINYNASGIFSTFIPTIGTLQFNAIATDTKTTPPYVFNSVTNTIRTNAAPSLAIMPSNTVLDAGQTETYSFTAYNGFGQFDIELYNITGASHMGTNAVILTPGGMGSVSFQAEKAGTFTFNGIGTDMGTTTPYPFGSQSNVIIVNPALKAPLLSMNGTRFDTGQSITLTSSVPTTGTSPYTYNFIIANSLSGSILFSSGQVSASSYAFNANSLMLGGDDARVVVTDSASTPATNTSADVGFSVESAPTVFKASNTLLDAGQTETYSFNVFHGFGQFNIELYNITGGRQQGSNVIIQVPGGTNTISFNAHVTGKFSYNAIITDMGTTTPYVFNSKQAR